MQLVQDFATRFRPRLAVSVLLSAVLAFSVSLLAPTAASGQEPDCVDIGGIPRIVEQEVSLKNVNVGRYLDADPGFFPGYSLQVAAIDTSRTTSDTSWSIEIFCQGEAILLRNVETGAYLTETATHDVIGTVTPTSGSYWAFDAGSTGQQTLRNYASGRYLKATSWAGRYAVETSAYAEYGTTWALQPAIQPLQRIDGIILGYPAPRNVGP